MRIPHTHLIRQGNHKIKSISSIRASSWTRTNRFVFGAIQFKYVRKIYMCAHIFRYSIDGFEWIWQFVLLRIKYMHTVRTEREKTVRIIRVNSIEMCSVYAPYSTYKHAFTHTQICVPAYARTHAHTLTDLYTMVRKRRRAKREN